jgi:hypothetical protein
MIRAERTENANGTGMIHVVWAEGADVDGETCNVTIWTHAPHVDGPLDPDGAALLAAILEWQGR